MTDKKEFDVVNADIAWCPRCGDFLILSIIKSALAELNMSPENVVLVSGIGQAGKMPQYLRSNFFNGLHGRPIPVATAVKTSNPGLNVIVTSGDGDVYGEGGNHFIHAIRRNPNITILVSNNMIYGLTKGQASPTSQRGFKTPIQTEGVILEPFNPLSTAIALDASFVARAFCGDMEKTKEIIKEAIKHKGLSIVDIFQPCVVFNKVNTYEWFKANTYYLENHNPKDRIEAFRRATETDKLPLGIFYVNNKNTFEENIEAYKIDKKPLFMRRNDQNKIKEIINSKF